MNRRKLSEVCTVIVPMRDKPKEFVGKGEGIPWCRIEDIEGKFLHCSKSSRYVTNECIEDMNLKVFPAGTVLCAVTGASIGKYAVTTAELITNQTFAGLVCGDEIYNEYLYYYIKLQTKALVNHSVGCAQEYITRETLENLTIPVYPYEEQIQLVSILKNIDDKISNNNAINAELEALAKTIYDYWFLQFEFPNEEGLPYKSSGGRMVWSEELKREIPEGWEVRQLSYLSEHITDGEHGSVSDNPDSGYYLLSCKNIVGGKLQIGNFERQISKDSFDKMRRRTRLEKGDILLSSVGTIGEVCMLDLVPDNIEFQRSVAIIKPDYSKVSSEWMYENILSMRKIIENTSHGAVQKCVFISDIVSLISILPPKSLMNKYTNMVEVYFRIISILRKENRELAALRDWLLPMLMNGQVGFKEEAT